VLKLDDEWIWDGWIADTGDAYHLFFLTAPRSLGDPALRHEEARIGHAVFSAAAGFGRLEVPQIRRVDGTWVLVFTCDPQEQTPEQVARFGPHSTWSVTAPGPLGPSNVDRAEPFPDEPALFAAPLVQRRGGSWAPIGFRNLEAEGVPSFEIIDPVPVRLAGGRLEAAR
jgi:beta-fructofuranosidase